MRKLKHVKRGFMVLHFEEEEYNELVANYEKLKEALYAVCGGACEDCPLDFLDTTFGIRHSKHYCIVQNSLDPKQNLKEEETSK